MIVEQAKTHKVAESIEEEEEEVRMLGGPQTYFWRDGTQKNLCPHHIPNRYSSLMQFIT